MSKAKVAIIGRPNVGKSSLFNRLAQKRIAIVDEAEGVTRDRLYVDCEVFGQKLTFVDTGGIDPFVKHDYSSRICHQADLAIHEAEALIMVVDAKIGITHADEFLAKLALQSKKPVLLAVNKVDTPDHEGSIHQFYALGIKNIYGISANHGAGVADLLEDLLKHLPSDELEEEETNEIKVSIVGRPNVGKSTIINYLLDEDRSIVSPIAGTTRDSIDVKVSFENNHYTFIDTAGIRKKKSEHEVVEKFAAIRTERAIERSDICVLALDATKGISTQEKQVLKHIESKGKGCLIFFNKWDEVKGFRMEHCEKALHTIAPFVSYCPVIFGSAKFGRNITKIFSHLQKIHKDRQKRISTGELNRYIERTMHVCHPPMIQGKRLRIYYMTQAKTNPPEFVFFINYKDRMTSAYQRYLINQFRKAYTFYGVPIKFTLREKKQVVHKSKQKALTVS